jgi:hypothetical protein
LLNYRQKRAAKLANGGGHLMALAFHSVGSRIPIKCKGMKLMTIILSASDPADTTLVICEVDDQLPPLVLVVPGVTTIVGG